MRWAFSFEFSSASAFLTNDERGHPLASILSSSPYLPPSLSACYSLLPSLSASTESVTQLLAHLQDSFDFSNLLEIIYQSDPCLPSPSPPLRPRRSFVQFPKSFRHFRFCLWHICQCGITNWWLRAEVDKIFHFICFYLYTKHVPDEYQALDTL